VTSEQVFDLVAAVAKVALSPKVANLLKVVIENGRLSALPEVDAQFRALVNASSGVSDATIVSAFPWTPPNWPTRSPRWRSASVASSTRRCRSMSR
jgi:F-type H+-transporting ATPase subunit delta